MTFPEGGGLSFVQDIRSGRKTEKKFPVEEKGHQNLKEFGCRVWAGEGRCRTQDGGVFMDYCYRPRRQKFEGIASVGFICFCPLF